MFEAIVFGIYFCGFRPRCALELDDVGESRIDKIYRIIGECRYGIHDVSRTQLDPINQLPRFNMPFELGIFLAAKRFGDAEQKRKRCVVFDVEQFRYQRFLSDLAGSDIRAHAGEIDALLREVRTWLANASRRQLPGHVALTGAYASFLIDRNDLALTAGLDPGDVAYADYERLVVGWLEAA